MSAGALACPACGRGVAAPERFCPACGLPLVLREAPDDPGPASEPVERARKVRRSYTEGELVRVAGGRNQTEAEFVQGLLLEEGVPSVLRRARGFDVPDFLAAGPRDVLVPLSGAQAARDVLLDAELAPTGPAPEPRAARVLAALVIGLLLLAAVVWAAGALVG